MEKNEPIRQIDYDKSPVTTPLGMDAFIMREYRQDWRAELLAPATLVELHRFDFYLWLWLSEGTCTHMLDFQTILQKPGESLLIRPGQVHRFHNTDDWDGWLVAFRPEFLLHELAMKEGNWLEKFRHLPEKQTIPAASYPFLNNCLNQIRYCLNLQADGSRLELLLRLQLYSLLTMLGVIQHDDKATENKSAGRVQRFRELLEQQYSTEHKVAYYAAHLACTEKTLRQNCLETLGMPTKAVINQRLILEAKRLLAHTHQPANQIAAQLGFDEHSHFGKFFKRETGLTPKDFRNRQQISQADRESTDPTEETA